MNTDQATDTPQQAPAVGAPLDRGVRPAVAVAHRSDEHLTLLGAPWHLNLLTGQDRADMLAFGRACMLAERDRCAKIVDNWLPYAGSVIEEINE